MREYECKFCKTQEKPFRTKTTLVCSICGNVLKTMYKKKSAKTESKT